MGQVTIYLDKETESRMKSAAQSEGVSVSRWVAELVRQKTATEWPHDVHRLAGAWPEFPDADTLRRTQGEDATREPF